MNANMKPIDAIRREMVKRGYDVGLDTNRRDICNMLGESRKTGYKRLCSLLDVEYNNSNKYGEFIDSQMRYLIDIENSENLIEFESIYKLSKMLLLGMGDSPKINDIIENQYIVWYNDRQYVISHTPQRELDPKYNFKYKMMMIRQVMKGRGYSVSLKTNRKDMCMMLDLPLDSTKKEIYEKLNIQYVKICEGGRQRWRRLKLTNPYDPSHTVEFRSMRAAERELNIRQEKLYTYIRNQSLTVEYEGCVFTVSFTEE